MSICWKKYNDTIHKILVSNCGVKLKICWILVGWLPVTQLMADVMADVADSVSNPFFQAFQVCRCIILIKYWFL